MERISGVINWQHSSELQRLSAEAPWPFITVPQKHHFISDKLRKLDANAINCIRTVAQHLYLVPLFYRVHNLRSFFFLSTVIYYLFKLYYLSIHLLFPFPLFFTSFCSKFQVFCLFSSNFYSFPLYLFITCSLC